MDVPIHHLLRQLRDTGWGWREIAVAFPSLGLDPAVDYDAVAVAARRDVTCAAGLPAADARQCPYGAPRRKSGRVATGC